MNRHVRTVVVAPLTTSSRPHPSRVKVRFAGKEQRRPAAGTAMSLRGLARPNERPDVRLYSSMYADQYDTVSHTWRPAAYVFNDEGGWILALRVAHRGTANRSF